MDLVKRAWELKQALLDFVLDAEGDLAVALESYTAEHLAQFQQQDMNQRDLVLDAFLTEGRVGDKTPLDLFVASQAELSADDRDLLARWPHAFTGLFAVVQMQPEQLELMNWLTAKHYTVKLADPRRQEETKRFRLGEIILARILPLDQATWMFTGPWVVMGNLGKPKLAVAIGNFKQNFKPYLYSDAPELLEEAWKSVERYHQDFLDFFGSDQVAFPGYQLSKKLSEFQAILSNRQLEEAGIDRSKSMAEIAAEAGMTEEDIEETAAAMGVDAGTMAKMMKSQEAVSKMVTPQIELPAEFKKAESVTVLADPRWGQMFLPTYHQVEALLQAEDWQSQKGADKLIRQYLEDPAINAFVWRKLAEQDPDRLEAVLQTVLERPDFKLQTDLDSLLTEYGKPLEPELPEIASVPLHLHNLFQEALAEVQKSKPKDKDKGKKVAKGFR